MKDYTNPNTHSWLMRLFLLSTIFILLTVSISIHPVNAQSSDLPEYVVKSGDTLYDIAIQFYTTVDAIIAANGLTSANVLNVGDHLKIPGLEGMKGVLTTEYVPLGASLTSLSRRSQSPVKNLVKLNKLTSPSELFIGSEIVTTISEETAKMETMPSLLAGQSLMEAAILRGLNTWKLANLNLLASPNEALSSDTFFVQSEADSPNNLAVPGVKSILIDHLPLKQGSTFVLKVTSDQPVQVKADLGGVQPPFIDIGSGEQIALGGIKALLDPGIYPLSLEFTTVDNNKYRFEQYVIISSGNYETDQPLSVDPSTLQDENTVKEDAVFLDLVSKVTPVQQWSGIFQYPVAEPVCIRSYFGSRRTYNSDPRLFYHTGLDLGYCGGIDVFAPAKGTVVAVKPDQIVRGNAIVIDHGLGVFTTYMHLKDILVKEGDVVEPGDLIAHLGTTGRSIGPHLHFQVDVNGIPVNPLDWLSELYP